MKGKKKVTRGQDKGITRRDFVGGAAGAGAKVELPFRPKGVKIPIELWLKGKQKD